MAPVLTSDQRQRALGAVIGAAAGDALGAPYEFQPPIAPSEEVAMVGGGMLGWEPAEWTDETSMGIVILAVTAELLPGATLSSPDALDRIAVGWHAWSLNTTDIGHLTSDVISRAVESAAMDGRPVPGRTDFEAAARAIYENEDFTAGNGALMRSHAIVPGSVHLEPHEFTQTVLGVTRLTHVDPDAADSSVLWAHAVRHAILTGEIVLDAGLPHIPADRREVWRLRIAEAADVPPSYFARSGWVVHTFQAACAVISSVGEVPHDKFAQRAFMSAVLDRSVRAGFDTDTLACTVGALVGAALGANAVEPTWRRELHGWPEYSIDDLEALVVRVLDLVDQALLNA